MAPEPAFQHAKAAIGHAAAMLGLIRADLGRPGLTRHAELMLRGALCDLEKRHALLIDGHIALLASDKAAMPGRWKAFLSLYDDFLEAARRYRLERIEDAK